MLTKQISIQKSEANWDELLLLVHQGNEIIIMNGDETIARMTSAETGSQLPISERILGAHPGAWMSDDFDTPLLS
ncbi:MAG: toxin-antitoxin (TA) system antitoxin [Anaerolineae bacterium]|nr:toxin-antitoxin (TA) system antitoxin [Anaerolineae bacterium]